MMECVADGDPSPKTRWTRVESDGSEMNLDLPRFKVVSGKGKKIVDLDIYIYIYIILYHSPNMNQEWECSSYIFIKGLQLRHVHPSQAGVYKCTATSTVGIAIAKATLNVHEAPMLTMRPPSEIVVAVGESASLDCFVV